MVINGFFQPKKGISLAFVMTKGGVITLYVEDKELMFLSSKECWKWLEANGFAV